MWERKRGELLICVGEINDGRRGNANSSTQLCCNCVGAVVCGCQQNVYYVILGKRFVTVMVARVELRKGIIKVKTQRKVILRGRIQPAIVEHPIFSVFRS